MADGNVCATCLYMEGFNKALSGADEVIFGNLHSPVVATLSAFATLALLFSTKIRAFVKSFAPEMEQQRWFMEMWKQSGKLVLVAIALTSYSFWQHWVVDNLNFLIFAVAGAVSTESGLTQVTNADIFNTGGSKDLFLRMMETVHDASYAPIEKLQAALSKLKFGIGDIAAGLAVGIGNIALSMFGSIANLMFFLILVMHKTMTVFVVGMGPLIMALWIFEATKHYAYSLLRFIAATGSSVIGASFLMGLSLAVVDASVSQIPMDMTADPPLYDVKGLTEWVLGGGMYLLIGAYVAMAFMMIIAAFMGFSVVLAQRPSLSN